MKKMNRIVAPALSMIMAFSIMACGKDNGADEASLSVSFEEVVDDKTALAAAPEEGESYEIPEGMYLSEITGEPISEDIKDQRPIAVMVDNEKTALPHFGTAEADVVYEMMNSTKNDRITRLMCIVKD